MDEKINKINGTRSYVKHNNGRKRIFRNRMF